MPRHPPAGVTNPRLQRQQELQADLAIKQRELDALLGEEAELKDSRGEQLSLVERCVKDKRTVTALPIEQIGNTMAQCSAVRSEEAAALAIQQKTVAEMRLQAAHGDRDIIALKARVEAIRKRTGHSDDPRSMYQRAVTASRHDRFVTDPAAVQEVVAKERQVRAEIHAANVLRTKKAAVLAELADAVVDRRGVAAKVEAAQAARLVAERDLRERKLQLRALLQRHADLDLRLEAGLAERDHTTRALMEHTVKNVADMTSSVSGERREEERLLKAQNFRLRQLAERTATVEAGMDRHGLRAEVEALAAEALRAAEEANPGGGGGGGGGVPSASDEALGPFLDADTVVPTDEAIPMAVFALFHADREKHRRNVRRQEIMLLEKTETKNAVLDKIGGLMEAYEARDDELYDQKVAQEVDIDARADDAMAELEGRRQGFNGVVAENRGLSRQIAELRRLVRADPASAAAAAAGPRWDGGKKVVVDLGRAKDEYHCVASDAAGHSAAAQAPAAVPSGEGAGAAATPAADAAPAPPVEPEPTNSSRPPQSSRASNPPPPVPPLAGITREAVPAAADEVQSGW